MGLEIPREKIHLEREIGISESGSRKGRWSKVFFGSCFGLEVVLKTPVELSEDKIEEFRNEVRMLSTIRHPNICMFLGASLRPPLIYLVTEHMRHGDLFSYLRDRRNKATGQSHLPLFARLGFGRDIALGMICVHQNQIIHRDLKPENCLVGDALTVKISDFGYSTIHTAEPHQRQCGTLYYMAPEIMTGAPYAFAVDVFSFGIILQFLLTLDYPYPRRSWPSTGDFIRSIVRDGLRPDIPSSCDPALASLMASCWDPLPSSRPSFDRIARDLHTLQLQTALPHPNAFRFWFDSFGHAFSPPWSLFVLSFARAFRLPVFEAPSSSSSDLQIFQDFGLLQDVATPTLDSSDRPHKHSIFLDCGPFLDTPLLMYPSDAEIRSASIEALNAWVQMHTDYGSPHTATERVKHELARRFSCEQLDCLRALLEVQEDSDPVKISEFSRLLALFGPLSASSCQAFLDNLSALLRHNWFYGRISSSEAHKLLSDKPANSFVLRFSTDPNVPRFALSIVSHSKATSLNEVVHIRINQTPPGEPLRFSIPGQPNSHPSIADLVLANIHSGRLSLTPPDTLSRNPKYAHLFAQRLAKNGPYAAVFTDDPQRSMKRTALTYPDAKPLKKSRNLKDD
ncbi:MAG: protein kinase [archaeon]|nr:protein kinase [archaeon]